MIPMAPPEYQKEIYNIYVRLASGTHYELRCAAALAFTELAKLPDLNKGKLLVDMAELVDDEQQEVSIVALRQLHSFLQ